MDVFDEILADWQYCRPDNVVLRADLLSDVIDLVAARVERSSAPRASRRYAFELLRPSKPDGGLPLLVKHLRVDGGYRFNNTPINPGVDCTGCAVVHFVCFWKALHEVWRRLRQGTDIEEEPIAEEIVAFRDALLRNSDDSVLLPANFMTELSAAKKMSADPPAWVSLEAEATKALSREASNKQLPLNIVSGLLLTWLTELTEDYLRGSRADKIQAVRDVLGCKARAVTAREACMHLGASGWDIESALRSFYIGGPPLAALKACSLGAPWSSQDAKLRSSELQCPICIADFCPSTESLVTKCCFQVVCVHCVASLTKPDGQLRCPFCRCVAESPAPHSEKETNQHDDLLAGVFRIAEKYADEATRITRGFMASFQTVEVAPQHDLRLDVIFRVRGA